MKIIKVTTVFLSLSMLLTAVSCDKYLDINDDPNNIALDKVTPEEMLPVGITSCYSVQGRSLNKFSSVVMNATAGNSLVYGAPFIDDYKPNVSNTFYNDVWDGLFRGVANLDKVITFNDPSNKYIQHKAIAKIMKANYVQILTDLYGDMPYSEAFKGQDNLTPKYDKGEDIYKASIESIEQAIAILEAGTGEAPASDIVFHGDTESWVKFANTLKLRYLLRMSNVTGTMAAYRDQKLASLSGAQFIDEDVLENPGYSAANDAQQNPFTNYYVYLSSGTRAANFSENVASENIQIILNGNVEGDTRSVYQKFNGITDGRRARMFSLVGGKVLGIRQGNLPGQPGVPSGTAVSRFSYGITIGDKTPTTVREYVDMASAKPGPIMTKAESKFLQAEAALRYPSLFSNAAGNFAEGITASYEFFGATGSAAYIAAIQSVPGLGWIGTDANKMEAIMTQKWIALTGVNPEQSFFDYTKTGFPVTLSATIATNPKPNRLMYPLSEYIANANNVPAISNADVFSKNQYTPFWARN
ncbi:MULTISPECIES: SusD/RagB family nutrient-binding outer membrane lipoprotein [unclassified Chryseobacterium]|uniref:SusD/RagB family nutrient-binding outer membrane lipoprotein n=1 Tax=unclassified Chryseobacterium TaxID=2593645 RepID=UPI000F45782E|nr:SusD/RagB family nutrient-binding outer membrane lipoprotein [Chryseobacterium sp. G0240]ROI01519.1 SusD/RagB family nutrient-binding outer membrane lipoprotein [Chryseobacterium sp. G0240]